MSRLTSTELREKYCSFFGERAHAVLPSASLVPANDPSVLFTTAGMHPLVPYLLGEPHPAGRRLVGAQKCVRTGDIDVIGDDTHLTFFEMLGNWSLGDYFREESIRWSFEFLTSDRWLALPLSRLGVTCFNGDDTSARLWRSLGLQRIQFLGRDDNWWGPAGKTGPCGPDTEIFYWVGGATAPERLDVRDPRWVEIWNNVFMSETKLADGTFAPLGRPVVDTGMGLERTLVALNGLRSVYEVDTMAPIFGVLSGIATRPNEHDLRVLTDHLRAACFMIADGVGPSNKDRGYVLRRILRRSLLVVKRLDLPCDWHRRGISAVMDALGAVYPELGSAHREMEGIVEDELSRFEKTLSQGLRMLEKLDLVDGKAAFDLFQTYGFPFELTCEIAAREGKEVDREDYLREAERHRIASRAIGGLADSSFEAVRYHTLTHLLQAALRRVLGEHVLQRGSHITHERLRFDFSHPAKLSSAELAEVASLVNGWLSRPFLVERSTMSEREARALGAIAAFGEKYGPTVSVYTVRGGGDVISRELCGGPHVTSSRDLDGHFQILREQSIAAGIRRIKATFDPR
jgi:alanyl-tRNA synthetase